MPRQKLSSVQGNATLPLLSSALVCTLLSPAPLPWSGCQPFPSTAATPPTLHTSSTSRAAGVCGARVCSPGGSPSTARSRALPETSAPLGTRPSPTTARTPLVLGRRRHAARLRAARLRQQTQVHRPAAHDNLASGRQRVFLFRPTHDERSLQGAVAKVYALCGAVLSEPEGQMRFVHDEPFPHCLPNSTPFFNGSAPSGYDGPGTCLRWLRLGRVRPVNVVLFDQTEFSQSTPTAQGLSLVRRTSRGVPCGGGGRRKGRCALLLMPNRCRGTPAFRGLGLCAARPTGLRWSRCAWVGGWTCGGSRTRRRSREGCWTCMGSWGGGGLRAEGRTAHAAGGTGNGEIGRGR